ncbi:MAG: LysM peptidoglycan-binding domain-containing protein [bacterium]
MIRFVVMIFCGLVFLLNEGCSRTSASVVEAKERTTSLSRSARVAEQTGDLKEAIRLYRTMLVEEPHAYSVHFHLATLLQDYEEDYISALYHYKQYLSLRPETEKTTLVQDRIRVTEQLLAPQLLRKLGESAKGLSQAYLLKETDTLKRQITKLEGEKSVMSEEKDRAEKALAAAQIETERLRELLNKMRASEKVERASEVASSAALAERERAAANTKARDGKSLRELRKEAEAIASDAATQTGTKQADESASDVLKKVQQKLDESRITPRVGASDTKMDSKVAMKEKKGKSVEPRTYVIQSGDSLFRVSEKFYGDTTHWKKIRDANRTNIDPDGRVRVGQTIIIP